MIRCGSAGAGQIQESGTGEVRVREEDDQEKTDEQPSHGETGRCPSGRAVNYSSDKEKAHPFTGGMNPTTWERISVSANGSFIHIESVRMIRLRRLSRPTKRIISDSAQATFERTPFEPLAVGSGQKVTLTPSMG